MTERMRVSMVSEHASPLAALGGVDGGGQNVHVANLALALAARGAVVDVHTRREDGHSPEWVDMAPGVRVRHVDAGPHRPVPKDELLPYMPRFATELRRALATDRPDVVHAHFWMSGLAALGATEGMGVPVVQTFHALGVVKRRHQGADDTSPAGRVREERRIARTVDHVLATCTDEVFELARLGARARRISVVPCGVDLAAFGPDGPCAPRDRRPRIVCLGRLVPRKGVDDAVRALALLPAAELVVSGGPPAGGLRADPEARRLRALADALGVGNRVTLTGAVARDRIPALLRSADVVVCAPWYEPFGIVPLEAMACARPVVSSAVGGLVDTVVHERTGLHVPPRDPRALADAVARLLADPALARRLGEAGLRRARARYSWDRVATQTAEVYRRVAGRHPARRRAAAW